MLFSDFQFPLYSGKEINSPPKEEDKTTYVSLQLLVQNAVSAHTLCWKIANISGSTDIFDCNFRWCLKTP